MVSTTKIYAAAANAEPGPIHSLGRFRFAVYEALHAPRLRWHRTIQWAIMLLIGVLVVDGICVGLPAHKDFTSSTWGRQLNLVIWLIFITEYSLRVWSVPERDKSVTPLRQRLAYMCGFFPVIDLIVIISMTPWLSDELTILRSLRCLFICSVLKLGRYSKGLALLGRVFKARRGEMVAALTIVAVLLLLASSLMHVLESKAQPGRFGSILSSLWWGIITLTTVGYGDAAPVTPLGKVAGGFIALLGIGVAAMPAGIMVAGIQEEMRKKDPEVEGRSRPNARDDSP